MLNDDHRDTGRRRREPLLPLLVTALLVLAAANPGAYAARPSSSPPAAGPHVPVTPPAGFDPFPDTTAMPETVRAALDAFNRAAPQPLPVAVDQAAAENAVLAPCAALSPRARLPFVRDTRADPIPVKRADLAVTIWPTPSIYVMRGATLSYELQIRNYGRAAVSRAQMTVPYQKGQMSLIGSHFSNGGDWVSELTDDHVTVTLAPIAGGAERTATLLYRVAGTLPNNAVISMRATYQWDDEHGSGSWRSNWAPVLVGNGTEDATWAWLAVTPVNGTSGTTFHFYTDRFIPLEGVVVWLNTPAGTEPTVLRPVADEYGRACVDFPSRGLRPGTYSLVLFGARSRITAVARFYVL